MERNRVRNGQITAKLRITDTEDKIQGKALFTLNICMVSLQQLHQKGSLVCRMKDLKRGEIDIIDLNAVVIVIQKYFLSNTSFSIMVMI